MTPLHFMGLLLLCFGVISFFWGDKKMPAKQGGIIMKFYDVSPTVAKWRKWSIGLGAIFAGLSILVESGMPSF